MNWRTIRDEFVRLRELRGWKQADVANQGGLPQSAISKLESNDNLGPTVEIFTKAIEGLGLSVADFFAHVEAVTSPVTRPGKMLPTSEQPNTGAGGAYERRTLSTAHPEQLDRVVSHLQAIANQLSAVSEAVTDRATAFITAPPDERTAAARGIAPERPVSRGRRRKTGGKAG